MSVRPIDANALHDALRDNEFQTFCPLDEVDEVIAAAPTIDLAPKWISVEDRVPDTRHTMLVCTRNRNNVPKIAMAYFENGFGWCGSGGRWNNVTHWMPLPEPPKEE